MKKKVCCIQLKLDFEGIQVKSNKVTFHFNYDIKALPMPEPDWDKQSEDWGKILKMVTSPTISQGKKVELLNHPYLTTPRVGVVRMFTETELYRLCKEYNEYILDPKFPTPDMSAVYDYYTIKEDGKVSVWHDHIKRENFEFML